MGTIKRFEEIEAWQKARQVVKVVYDISKQGVFARDFGLKEQIRRSSVSIMANIAEGFARKTPKEFINFLNMAHGSSAEVQSHLYVALDQKYIGQSDFYKIYAQIDEISKMILGFIIYLRKSNVESYRTR